MLMRNSFSPIQNKWGTQRESKPENENQIVAQHRSEPLVIRIAQQYGGLAPLVGVQYAW
jgi:hypothetical protein